MIPGESCIVLVLVLEKTTAACQVDRPSSVRRAPIWRGAAL